MIRMAVLPYARSGVVSATLLGLGRALGETMAIALIISPSIGVTFKILTDGSNAQTIAANLALNFPESNSLQREALIGTGLMLFVVSLAVNFIARWIVSRSNPGRPKRQRKPRPEPDRSVGMVMATTEIAGVIPTGQTGGESS
jgi:phosphate transport system permease protein